MVRYRRHRLAGGTYLFTVVLADRSAHALTGNIGLLRMAFRRPAERPFALDLVNDGRNFTPSNACCIDEQIESSVIFEMNASTGRLKSLRKFRAVGDLLAARDLLEGMCISEDDILALYYLKVLDELDDQAAKQTAVIRLIDSLSDSRSDTFLTMLMRQSERACLPIDMTAKVLALAATKDTDSGELAFVYNAVRRRQAFQKRMAPQALGVRLISIGGGCMPWTVPNRWGFRSARQFVDDFNPFCLALHYLSEVLRTLDNNFEIYLDPASVVVRREENVAAMFARKNGSAQWRHNLGPYWTQYGFERLQRNLRLKIENYRRSCVHRGPVAFLMEGLFPNANELAKLKSALSKAVGHNDYLLILSNHDYDVQASEPVLVDDNVIRFHCPTPTEDYKWFNLSTADSPAGLDFEESYATKLLSCFERVTRNRAETSDRG